MRRFQATLASLLLATAGCHSAYVEAVVVNRTPQPISLIEVDYPSASFGTQTLPSKGEFRYRFKILGSGPLKLIYTDHANREHHTDGPSLQEGQEGSLEIIILDNTVQWHPTLASR